MSSGKNSDIFLLNDLGITVLGPFMTIPSFLVSSSRYGYYCWSSSESFACRSGQPWCIILHSCWNVASSDVCSFNSSLDDEMCSTNITSKSAFSLLSNSVFFMGHVKGCQPDTCVFPSYNLLQNHLAHVNNTVRSSFSI